MLLEPWLVACYGERPYPQDRLPFLWELPRAQIDLFFTHFGRPPDKAPVIHSFSHHRSKPESIYIRRVGRLVVFAVVMQRNFVCYVRLRRKLKTIPGTIIGQDQ